jgi:hypothetical protein
MSVLPIAALVYATDTNPSPVLVEVARILKSRGVGLVGAIQHDLGPKETCGMELELLPSGERLPMSQDLGPGSNACRLDPAAMAEAGAQVRKAIEAGQPELAIFNKFGTQEVAGEGLRDEMVATVMAGIPLLTAVAERFGDDWAAFTGGETSLIPCTVEDALAWWSALNA